MPNIDDLNSGAPPGLSPSPFGIGLPFGLAPAILGQTQNPKTEFAVNALDVEDFDRFFYPPPGSYTFTAGQLVITPDNTYPGIRSSSKYDFTSSSATVEVVQAPNLGTGTTEAFLFVEVDGSGANRVAMQYSGGNLVFRELAATVDDSTSITYDPVAHRWWRIGELAGTLTWSTSPDGIAWTTQRVKAATSITVPLTSMDVVLATGFFGTEPTPGTAVFDNLNLTPVPPNTPTPAVFAPVQAWSRSAAGAIILRSTADPVVTVDSLPAVTVARAAPVAQLAPAAILLGSDLAAETDYPATIDVGVAPRAVPASTPAATVIRSTADPAAAPTPPAAVVARAASSSTATPQALVVRSTADPATVDVPTRPVVAAVVQPAAAAPRALVDSQAPVEEAARPGAPVVATVPVTAPRQALPGTVTRSTADPAQQDARQALVLAVTPTPPPAAPPTIVVVSRDVTALQPSSNPAQALVAPVGRQAPTAAPMAALTRSTADPAPTDSPQRILVVAVASPAVRAAAALVVDSPVEDAPSRTQVVVVARAHVAAAAAQPYLTRGTADPAPSTDTPTAPVVARAPLGPLAAPGAVLAGSRDVTPAQPSSNPAAPILGRALWSTTAPPAVLARSTQDPVPTDTPQRVVVAPVRQGVPVAAPRAVLASSEADAPVVLPVATLVVRPTVTVSAAPASAVARSAPSTALDALPVVAAGRAVPGVAVPVAALLTRTASTPPPEVRLVPVTAAAGAIRYAAQSFIVRATYGDPPPPNPAGLITSGAPFGSSITSADPVLAGITSGASSTASITSAAAALGGITPGAPSGPSITSGG